MTVYNGQLTTFKQSPAPNALPSLPGNLQYTQSAALAVPTLFGPIAPPPVPPPDPGDGLHLILLEPEAPFEEALIFNTSVLEHLDGTEQRIAFRPNPQVSYKYKLRSVDDLDNQYLDNLLYGTQDEPMFIPLWLQPTTLSAPIIIGDMDAALTDAGDREIAVDHYYMVYENDSNYSIFIVESISTNLITNTTDARKAHPAGTPVYPVKKVQTPKNLKSNRFRINVRDYDIELTDTDTSIDLADLAGWPTYAGSLIFADSNAVRAQTINSTYFNKITILDSEVGIKEYKSDFLASKRISNKVFIAKTQAERWTLRQLLYGMRGRQKSFFLPTFLKDFDIILALSSASDLLRINNAGYTNFSFSATGHKIIRVVKTDGTTITRTITASAEDIGDIENITVDSVWGEDVALADIERVEFLEKVRFNNDTFVLTHFEDGTMVVGVPVITVY